MKSIYLENIGEVLIKKSARSKYIRISVNPFEPVTLLVPTRVSIKDSLAALKSKEQWILLQLKKNSTRQPRQMFTDNTQFKTHRHHLSVEKGAVKQCMVRKRNLEFTITYPENENIAGASVQDFIKNTIAHVVRKEAREYLPDQTAALAERYKFSYKKLFIKNSKTRWGSCSSVNNINLNLHLVLLPVHLSDYVILHELVHTVEKNHGVQFWKKLSDLTGDARKLRKELHQYSHYLHQIYMVG